jgi:hypothetical protein
MSKKTIGGIVVLMAGLFGCGGGGGGTVSAPSAPAAPPAPTRTLVGQGTFTLADASSSIRAIGIPDVAGVPFQIGASGTVDISVDWTFRSNDVDVAILRGNCNSNQVIAGQCGTQAVVQSLSTTAKPETLNVRLDAGNYTLAILSNVGDSAESGTFAIFVTR